jgi:glycosyltransferase involved in cell wall biosynthesis
LAQHGHGGVQVAIPRTISVLVPAYNEARNLEGAVRDAIQAAASFEAFEILIVNDGSTDDTPAVAERLAQEIPQVKLIHHPRNLGFARAYRTALEHAQMSYFTFVPGDHEVAAESVQDIFGAVGNADLVVPYHGTPWKRPMFRRVLTWICTTELNLLFGWRFKYYQGPTVYPTALARQLPNTVPGFFFATEMLVHAIDAGYSWIEVGLTHQERAYGRSKAVAWSNIVNAEKAILRLWFDIRVRNRRVVQRVRHGASQEVLEGIHS